MHVTKMLIMSIILIEGILFFAWLAHDFFWGEIFTLKRDTQVLVEQLQNLAYQLKEINGIILDQQRYPFYKEKIAREQLQMARKDDVIFYFSREKEKNNEL